MSETVIGLADLSLSQETLQRIYSIRSVYEAVVDKVLSTCVEGPERTVAIRLLQESLSCACKCTVPDENPFLKANFTERVKYMKKHPLGWEGKMKQAGLKSPYDGLKSGTCISGVYRSP